MAYLQDYSNRSHTEETERGYFVKMIKGTASINEDNPFLYLS